MGKKIAIFCQLGFSSKIKEPQLGSARDLHSSARLEPKNSSSGSSLLFSIDNESNKVKVRTSAFVLLHHRMSYGGNYHHSMSPFFLIR